MNPGGLSACVIGAQGALGRVVAGQLAEAGWTVYPAGRRPDQRSGYRRLDLDSPETIGPAVRDVDLVISTIPHRELAAERHVLEHGGVLINCSHAPSTTTEVLAREVKEPKGAVLINAGLAPGIANLEAVELLSHYPEADCLEVAFTILSAGTAGKAGGEFAYQGLSSRSHHRVVRLPLPHPFGDTACIETAGSDGYFGSAAGTRTVETYLGFADLTLNLGLRTANALRLMRLLPKPAFAAERGRPDRASREPTAVWLGARKGGERLGSSIIECEGDYRTTAEAARLFGQKLLAADRAGCFNPEDVFSIEDLLPLLTAEGTRISRS